MQGVIWDTPLPQTFPRTQLSPFGDVRSEPTFHQLSTPAMGVVSRGKGVKSDAYLANGERNVDAVLQ